MITHDKNVAEEAERILHIIDGEISEQEEDRMKENSDNFHRIHSPVALVVGEFCSNKADELRKNSGSTKCFNVKLGIQR